MANLKKPTASVLFALLTAGNSVSDTLFKARSAALLLASATLRGEGLSREALQLLVEEDAGLLPRSHIWDLVQSLPLLEERDGHFRLRERIFLSNFQHSGERPLPRALQSVSWSLDEVTSVFFPVQEAALVHAIRGAIHRGYRWLLWTLGTGAESRNQFESLPAFWECGETDDSPVGELRAITSVGDTLASLADSYLYACSIVGLPGDHRAAFENGLNQLLLYPVESDTPPNWDAGTIDWNRGGFLPYDDQPEAAYPTVDATWDAVLSLSSIYEQYNRVIQDYGSIKVSKEEVGFVLIGGVNFILRMELPTGGWGVYRYREDRPQVAAHEFTTGQTILALCRVLGTNVFEAHGSAAIRLAAESALRRACTLLNDKSVRFEALRTWVPFFGDAVGANSPQDLLRATVWTGTGLLALHRTFEDLRPDITPLLQDVVALADRHWRPDYRRIADVEFRVPLKDRLHDTFAKWSNRYDVTVAILLLDLFNENCKAKGLTLSFGPALWDKLEQTVGYVLTEQHHQHGHWHEPIEGLPHAPATAMAIQALQLYLIAAGHLAKQPDVPATQV